jgi:hypothetical protein
LKYELINPHDHIIFDASDDAVAEVAVVLVGDRFGWENTSDGTTGGMLAISKPAGVYEELRTTLLERPDQVIAALRSFRRAHGSDPVDPISVAHRRAQELVDGPAPEHFGGS